MLSLLIEFASSLKRKSFPDTVMAIAILITVAAGLEII